MPQLLLYEHQMQVKRGLHGKGPRLATDGVVEHVTAADVREHTTTWEGANRQYWKHITASESFTHGVPKKMVGGKAYWYVKSKPDPCL